MFGPPGFAYVYFTYGMHWCFNIVTERVGVAGAVLIRAVEPVKGLELMQRNRKMKNIKNLTNGPAKFTQAFGIDKKFNGQDLSRGNLNVFVNEKMAHQVVKAKRIGISMAEHALLRFYIKDNPFVSVK